MVNDVWGLRADPELAGVVARRQAPVILMHNRSSWAHAEIKERLGGRYIGMPYENLIEDIRRELLESVATGASGRRLPMSASSSTPGSALARRSSRTWS